MAETFAGLSVNFQTEFPRCLYKSQGLKNMLYVGSRVGRYCRCSHWLNPIKNSRNGENELHNFPAYLKRISLLCLIKKVFIPEGNAQKDA